MQYKIGNKREPQIIKISEVQDEISNRKVTIAKQFGQHYDKELKVTLMGMFEVWSYGKIKLETQAMDKAVELYNSIEPKEKKS